MLQLRRKFHIIKIMFFSFIGLYFTLAIIQLGIRIKLSSYLNSGVDSGKYADQIVYCGVPNAYKIKSIFIIGQIFFGMDLCLLFVFLFSIYQLMRLTGNKPSKYAVLMGIYLVVLILYNDILSVDYCTMTNWLTLFYTNLTFNYWFLFSLYFIQYILYFTIFIMFYKFGKQQYAPNIHNIQSSSSVLKGSN
jgi:hypothetical protein